MIFDALGAFFAFDSKAIRSIPRLLFQPGKLTTEYLEGKRETYLAPFRLYLFISIILFLTIPLIVQEDKIITNIEGGSEEVIDSLKQNFEGAELDSLLELADDNGLNFSLLSFDSEDTTDIRRWSQATKLVEDGTSIRDAVDSSFHDEKAWARLLIVRLMKVQEEKGRGLITEFINSSSYTLFLFLPMFALILKLFYIRRSRYYIEHLIFALHYFSFFFVLITLWLLILYFFGFMPFWIVFIPAFFYFLFALKRVYAQSWGKTSLKSILLLITTIAFLIPFFIMVALIISIIFY